MHHLARDVRDAWRGLVGHRAFSAAAVIMLALGVAASSAIFAARRAVVFEVPFDDPDRVVTIRARGADAKSLPIQRSQFETWRHGSDLFEAMGAYTLVSPVLTGHDAAARLQAEAMTASMFAVLGVQPRLGRTFRDDDGAVIVLSDAFWQSRFAGDPGVLGRSILLDGIPTIVVGVMPPAFDGPRSRPGDGWLPFHAARSPHPSRPLPVNVVARLAEGVTVAQARTRLEALPSANGQRWTAMIETAREDTLYVEALSSINVLAGGVVLIMLMACVNVSSLIVGRNVARQRELAVRLALGATRLDLVRYVGIETLLISCAGTLAGLVGAWWIVSAMVPLVPRWFPRIAQIDVDWGVATFAALVATASALIVAVWPAWTASGQDAGVLMNAGARGHSGAHTRARTVLVVVEATLAMIVLSAAAMLTGSFTRLNPTTPGFDFADRHKFSVRLAGLRYQDPAARIAAVDEIAGRLRSIAGVVEVSSVTQLPLTGTSTVFPVRVNRTDPPAAPPTVHFRAALPNYLPFMGMTLLRGRGLTIADTSRTQPVTVVNETLVARMLAGVNPLGAELVVEEPDGPVVRRIVGVVRDVRNSGNDLRARPEMFVPYAQAPLTLASFVVRSDAGAAQVAQGILRALGAFDPSLPADRLESLGSVVAKSVDVQRFYAMLMGAFAIVAASLAFFGLYSVAAWSVAQRTREIGVRLAIGASPGAIKWLVLRYGAAVGISGALIGLASAAGFARVIESYLYGFSSRQPVLLAALAVGLTLIATIAAYVPARRAMRIDPIAALRSN